MTVWSTVHALDREASEPVPIGRPLSLTQAIVTDAHGNPVPRGLPGELLLAGHGIAEGYADMEEADRLCDRVAAGL